MFSSAILYAQVYVYNIKHKFLYRITRCLHKKCIKMHLALDDQQNQIYLRF